MEPSALAKIRGGLTEHNDELRVLTDRIYDVLGRLIGGGLKPDKPDVSLNGVLMEDFSTELEESKRLLERLDRLVSDLEVYI